MKATSTLPSAALQPLVELERRLLDALGLEDGAELVDEEPSAVDALVRGGELVDERPLFLRSGCRRGDEDEARVLRDLMKGRPCERRCSRIIPIRRRS